MTHPYIYTGLPEKEKHFIKFNISMHDPNDIISAACMALNQKKEDIIGKSRKREHVECRQIAMGIIRLNSKKFLKDIGAMFNRDHSTVVYACDTFHDLYGLDKDFTRKVDAVKMFTNSI